MGVAAALSELSEWTLLLHVQKPFLNCSIKKFKLINLNDQLCFQNSFVIFQDIDFVLL